MQFVDVIVIVVFMFSQISFYELAQKHHEYEKAGGLSRLIQHLSRAYPTNFG
jgi:hypothetical protein